MKCKLILLLQLAFLYGAGQCPNPGLQVESETCAVPQNTSIETITCSRLTVQWHGQRDKQYVVKAVMSALASDEILNAEVLEMRSETNGVWHATLAVDAGKEVNWSVQAACSITGATLLSYPVIGPKTIIPRCATVESKQHLQIKLFPNPSYGTLTIYYPSLIENSVSYSVYDNTGKKVYFQATDARAKGNSNFQLNLQGLVPGSYLLKVKTNTNVETFKFILLSK